MKIKVKYIRDVSKLKNIEIGDWIDLRTGIDVVLKKGDFTCIPLGVAMQLPKYTEALLIPRSSTFKKYGIIQTNSVGLIDNSFCGDDDEWMMPVYATRDVKIPKDTRICQFRLLPNMMLQSIEEVEVLGNATRGGFGSTGEQ